MVAEKQCTKCLELKPLSAFSTARKHHDGLVCHCKDCQKIKSAAWRAQQRPERRIWEGIRERCCYIWHPHYPRYGGRGIYMCKRWYDSFDAFYKDMGPRPYSKHDLHRIDNDGPYDPGNCAWVPHGINIRERPCCKLNMEKAVEIRRLHESGFSYSELARRFGVHQSHVGRIVNNEQWKEGVYADHK